MKLIKLTTESLNKHYLSENKLSKILIVIRCLLWCWSDVLLFTWLLRIWTSSFEIKKKTLNSDSFTVYPAHSKVVTGILGIYCWDTPFPLRLFRSPLSAKFWGIACWVTKLFTRARKTANIPYFIDPTTCHVYSRTLVPLSLDWLHCLCYIKHFSYMSYIGRNKTLLLNKEI